MMPVTQRGSVYIAVIAVIAVVTLLTLTGVELRKRLHDRSAVAADSAAARQLATSAAELVVQQAYADHEGFLATAVSEKSIFEDLTLLPGRISATIRDSETDGAVTPETSRYTVVAEGSAGIGRTRLGFELHTPEDDLTILLRNQIPALAYWPLDETNWSQATEVIQGWHGQYTIPEIAGDTTHVHGNKAPRMSWMTEYVRVPHRSEYQLASGTLCFWVRFDTKPTGSGQQVAMVAKEISPLDSSLSLAIYMDKDYLYYILNNAGRDGRAIRFNENKITQGQWHFIAITWGIGGMQLYLDGERESDHKGTQLGLNSSLIPLRPANTSDWYFGVRNIPAGLHQRSSPTLGSVARVALFSSRLQEEQIAKIYETSSLAPGFRLVPGSFSRVVD